MTRTEFIKVTAYLAAGCGKAIAEQSLEVYFDCLGDLPYGVLLVAAKRVLLEHRYANFPSIAELREAAAETVAGQIKYLSPTEAWALAWRAVGQTDPEVNGSFERATKSLPTLVIEAIKAYGIHSLCYGDEPMGVVRGQFMKIYEQLAAREKRRALMPKSLTQAIAGTASGRALPEGTVHGLIGKLAEQLTAPS